jgi:hypothetical protein
MSWSGVFPFRLTSSLALTAGRGLIALSAGLDAAVHAGLGALEDAWRNSAPPASAVLIDLDNLGVKRLLIKRTLTDVLSHARPFVHAVAAGHPDVTEPLRDMCLRLDIEVLDTDGGANAADLALLATARRMCSSGQVTHFFVASHDRAFVDLPAPYTVLVTGPGQPARALTERAQAVRRIA